jgi:hypothetical protein
VEGTKALQIAGNYKAFFQELAGRAPSFLPAVKEKLLLVASEVMEGTELEEKMIVKLDAAVDMSVDAAGL